MRLLAFRTFGDDEIEVVLHPRVTVVTGLDATRRARLAAALTAMLRGDRGVGEAVFDVDGVPVPLTDETWAARARAFDDLAVLTASDLPPRGGVAAGARDIEVFEADDLAPDTDEDVDVELAIAAVDADAWAAWRDRRDVAEGAAVAAGARLASAEGAVAERQAALYESERQHADACGRRDALAAAPAPDASRHRTVAEAYAGLVEDARRALDRARQDVAGLARADDAVDPALVADLEVAHRAVLDAEDKPGRTARRRLDDALARERAVLDRMGMPSYEAYLVRTSVVGLAGRDTRLAQARLALADAQAVWDELHAPTPTDDVPDAAAPDEPGRQRAAIDDDVARAERQVAAARARVVEAEEHRRSANDAWRDARDAADAIALQEPSTPPAVDAVIDLDGPMRATIDVTSPLVADTASVDGDELEIYLLSRLLTHRNGASDAGSMPLIVDDAFGGLAPETRESALALLSRTADGVQVVYLTDDPDVELWAMAQGPSDAHAVRAPAFAGSSGATAL